MAAQDAAAVDGDAVRLPEIQAAFHQGAALDIDRLPRLGDDRIGLMDGSGPEEADGRIVPVRLVPFLERIGEYKERTVLVAVDFHDCLVEGAHREADFVVSEGRIPVAMQRPDGHRLDFFRPGAHPHGDGAVAAELADVRLGGREHELAFPVHGHVEDKGRRQLFRIAVGFRLRGIRRRRRGAVSARKRRQKHDQGK